MRKNAPATPAKAASPWQPVVRKMRRPASGSSAAASSSVATSRQSIAGSRANGGRSMRSSVVPVRSHASYAYHDIRSANGWVASTTASTRCPAM